MSSENQWLEDVFPIEIVHFLGDMLVFGGVSICDHSSGRTRFCFRRRSAAIEIVKHVVGT